MRIRAASNLEKAKSILLSDHHHSKAELDRIGEAIRSGRPVAYDPVALATNERVLDIMESNPEALICAACGEDQRFSGRYALPKLQRI